MAYTMTSGTSAAFRLAACRSTRLAAKSASRIGSIAASVCCLRVSRSCIERRLRPRRQRPQELGIGKRRFTGLEKRGERGVRIEAGLLRAVEVCGEFLRRLGLRLCQPDELRMPLHEVQRAHHHLAMGLAL